MGLEVSGFFACETGRVCHVTGINEKRVIIGFFGEVNFGSERMGSLFWGGSGGRGWSAFRRGESANGGGSSLKGLSLNDFGQSVGVFLYACSLERGKEGGFLFLRIREHVLVLCPGLIDDGKFGILSSAGSGDKLISRVSEESIGGDRRGGEIYVLHFV